MKNKWLAFAVDALLVLIFVGIGRSSHAEGLAGTFLTAVPFLLGLCIVWILPMVRNMPFNILPAGLSVWLGTAALGHLLRLLFGGTSALSFFIVTLGVLGVFLVGWRALWLLIDRRRQRVDG